MSLVSVDRESETFFQLPKKKGYESCVPSATRNIPKYARSVLREIRPRPYINKQVLVRQVENPQYSAACATTDDVIIVETHNPVIGSQINNSVSESSKHKLSKRNGGSPKKSSRKFTKEPAVPIPTTTGFEAGYEAEAILGAKDGQTGIFYLVKWKEREEMELVPALTTLTYVPSLVILFYAKRLQWISSSLSAPG